MNTFSIDKLKTFSKGDLTENESSRDYDLVVEILELTQKSLNLKMDIL